MHLTTQIAQQTGPVKEQDHLVTDRNNWKLAIQWLITEEISFYFKINEI